MTSHHDVAGATSALRSERNLRRAWRLEVASLLESQAKALSEAEAERDRIKAFLSEGDWQTIESEQAWRRRALAAEARLAEAMKVIEAAAAIRTYNLDHVRLIETARAFTNAAKEKT